MALIISGSTGIDFPSPITVSDGGTGLSSPGTSGYLLTSNGTSWVSAAAPISLPTQTGNNGKYLTTDGSSASWATLTLTLSAITNGSMTVNESGNVIATGSFKSAGLYDSSSRLLLIKNDSGTVVWGN